MVVCRYENFMFICTGASFTILVPNQIKYYFCAQNSNLGDMLEHVVDNSAFPIVTAFLLGLMTTISPCPFCTNITAISFISKDVKHKRTVLLNGLMYALGKVLAYSFLALVFLCGADIIHVQHFFETYGEPAMGPFLIVCGLFMLVISKFHHHGAHHHDRGSFNERMVRRSKSGNWWWAFVLGIVFSLAFCPYSGVLYFGMLIPMTLAQPAGWLLPIVFGIATGLPVIAIAFTIAYGVSGVGRLTNRMATVEVWFRRMCACLFIVVGVYMCISVFGGNGHNHGHEHGECQHFHEDASSR